MNHLALYQNYVKEFQFSVVQLLLLILQDSFLLDQQFEALQSSYQVQPIFLTFDIFQMLIPLLAIMSDFAHVCTQLKGNKLFVPQIIIQFPLGKHFFNLRFFHLINLAQLDYFKVVQFFNDLQDGYLLLLKFLLVYLLCSHQLNLFNFRDCFDFRLSGQ